MSDKQLQFDWLYGDLFISTELRSLFCFNINLNEGIKAEFLAILDDKDYKCQFVSVSTYKNYCFWDIRFFKLEKKKYLMAIFHVNNH